MKKSYLYMGLAEGVVGMRTFACWCHACMQAVGRGEGSLDTNLLCSACVSPHLIWHERSCARTDALGVANSRAKAQGHARKLATQLKRSLESDIRRVLIAVQNRGEDDQDQYPPFRSHLPGPSHLPPLASVVVALSAAPPSHRYWLGWATRVVKTHTSSGTVPGTRVRYDAGDLEIEIEWLQRDVSGGDERRTFRTWAATPADEEAGLAADEGPVAGKVYTINSTELRAVSLVLLPVAPVGGAPLGVVARVRRTAAVACDVARRQLPGVNQAVHRAVEAPPLRQLFTLSAADENVILSNCW